MDNKPELLVLYINRNDNTFHQVLLNPLELNKIGVEITNIFSAKKSGVMVSDTKLRIFEEVETNGKENSGEIR